MDRKYELGTNIHTCEREKRESQIKRERERDYDLFHISIMNEKNDKWSLKSTRLLIYMQFKSIRWTDFVCHKIKKCYPFYYLSKRIKSYPKILLYLCVCRIKIDINTKLSNWSLHQTCSAFYRYFVIKYQHDMKIECYFVLWAESQSAQSMFSPSFLFGSCLYRLLMIMIIVMISYFY